MTPEQKWEALKKYIEGEKTYARTIHIETDDDPTRWRYLGMDVGLGHVLDHMDYLENVPESGEPRISVV